MATRRRSRGWSPIKVLLVALLCLGAGVGVAVVGQQGLRLPAMPALGGGGLPGAQPADRLTAKDPNEMSRLSLERENKRLNDLVMAKDQEIAELTMQLKLVEEGSRTR